jgi:hypothetical protein
MSMWTMYRDGKRFSGVRWVVVATCVAGLSADVQLLTPLSFVVVTLYMVATILVAGGPLPFRFFLVAFAWLKYVQCFLPQF